MTDYRGLACPAKERADHLRVISREVVDSAKHLMAESRVITRAREPTMRIKKRGGHSLGGTGWIVATVFRTR